MGEHLRGQYGLSDAAVEESGDSVAMTVFVNGEERGRFTAPNEIGWLDWQVDTPGMSGARATVSIQSEARREDVRHFCLTGATTTPNP